MRRTLAVSSCVAALVGGVPLATVSSAADGADPAVAGALSAVVAQPNTRAECFTAQYQPTDGYRCPPAAMAVAVLPTGKVLFWDGLEGMNRVQYNVVAEFGDVAQDDQSRIADFSRATPTFSTPGNQTATGTDGHDDAVNPLLPGGAGVVDSGGNNYDLFCSPLVQLADGTVLAAGGTHYYEEPGVTDPTTGKSYGVAELQGLKATRIFDPATNTWHNAKGDMHFGRWYPTMVTLPNGHVFVASGVTKLIKPAYTDGRPAADSGRNVPETETYDPATQQWTVNHSGQTALNGDDTSEQSLPLFSRLHLLPDGKVYYDAAGQTFNPDGQAYDEATWVNAKLYDPATQAWSDLPADNTPTGLPLVDGAPIGFRGSGFSVLLPLTPDATGHYRTAKVFNGGGVVGPTPGNYFGDDSTTINTITTNATTGQDTLQSDSGPQLLNKRWYGDAVVLPDGTVFVTNGASRDEVDAPGSGNPVFQTELVDPAGGTVTAGPSLDAAHGRTYHNSAVLLPDGRVLIGGHAPIATGYAFQSDAGSAAGLSKPEADSTFQIYEPPYLHYGVARPVITDNDRNVSWNGDLTITSHQASSIGKVVLVRNPSQTHLTDGDQRSVELRIKHQEGDSITVAVPGSNVLPAGPYMLFIERAATVGGKTRYVPSVSRQVTIDSSPRDPGPDRVTPAPRHGSALGGRAATHRHASTRPATRPAADAAAASTLRTASVAQHRTVWHAWAWLALAALAFAGVPTLLRRRLRRGA
ncbi:MAG: hypothetical protein QOJ03_1222 [Frankiaceae bacterium]|nr:hypothetical protein [Frankiaceae bacterium]